MATRSSVLRALRGWTPALRPAARLRVLELGAGDGSLMLGVARALATQWPPVELSLLDRQDLLDRTTAERYAGLGWAAGAHVIDVLEWAAADRDVVLGGEPGARWDLIVTNLFLHHFEGAELDALLAAVAARSSRFLACEPRRARLALAGSHLIGALGVNAVTREDAVLSVRAGFRDTELTSLWSRQAQGWQTKEYAAGLFSHCFAAELPGAA
jgi:hypothetical protein